MKKILYIADFDFWNRNQGVHTKFNTTYDQFKNFDQYILFNGYISRKEMKKVKKIYKDKIYFVYPFKRRIIASLRIILKKLHIHIPKRLYNPLKQSFILKHKLKKIIRKENIDILWIYYIWYFDYKNINSDVITILDTQDIQSEIVKYKKENNIFFPSLLTFEKEIDILKDFDYVIAVSRRDFNIYTERLHNIKYLPFYFKTDPLKRNESKVKRIGFIGGSAEFNIITVNRIIERILPLLKTEYELVIYGKVCDLVEHIDDKRVKYCGLVDNMKDAYMNIDIAINPVSIGSGLKTKCVEAMSFGIPLITTSIGAQGLEGGINTSFLLADTDEEIASAIDRVINDKELYDKLSKNGLSFIENDFSMKYYDDLKKILEN